MKQYYSDVLQFRGSHYDFGCYQGELLKTSPILKNRETQQRERRGRRFTVDSKRTREILKEIAPAVLDEIHGLADTLHIDIGKAFQLFGGYYMEYPRSGCSIFTDSDFMVRNYDSHPRGYEGRYIFYQPTDHGYATVGPTMQITGRIDGMNEKGLAMGYNFTHSKKAGDGFICNMIGRLILETCRDVDEAVDLVKNIPHMHSFSYVVIDQTGVSKVIEASPRKVVVREANVCTNHFHILQEENRYRQEESKNREQNILNAEKNVSNPYEAFKVMNSLENGIFSKNYDGAAGTLHTSLYFQKELKALYVIGADRQPVIFDFNKWMNGDNVNVTRIKGELDDARPFINME